MDATFFQHHQRESFGILADQLGCELFIMDVFAPKEVLTERIERRSVEGHDASDATIDIMEQQQETEEAFTQKEVPYVIEVDSADSQAIMLAIKEMKRKIHSIPHGTTGSCQTES